MINGYVDCLLMCCLAFLLMVSSILCAFNEEALGNCVTLLDIKSMLICAGEKSMAQSQGAFGSHLKTKVI